jgi:hypothetical protein
MQDSSCQGSGGVPQLLKKVPQDWGIRGLIATISAVSIISVFIKTFPKEVEQWFSDPAV